jgi:hypothetical protein
MGDKVNELSVEPENMAEARLAEPRCAVRDHVEDRLHIGRRPAYHIEHIAGRSLIIERFLQLAAARLNLVEQALLSAEIATKRAGGEPPRAMKSQPRRSVLSPWTVEPTEVREEGSYNPESDNGYEVLERH